MLHIAILNYTIQNLDCKDFQKLKKYVFLWKIEEIERMEEFQ